AMMWKLWTTAQRRMNERVPWRRSSNSRRSTLPGTSGSPGGVRSSAWTPVSSSVLTPRSAALGEGRGLVVEGADVGDLGVEPRIGGRRRQPVADQVRLEIPR